LLLKARLPCIIPPVNESKPLPLAGVRVIDFTWVVAGPQATRILAALGAEVIRVENEAHPDSIRVGFRLEPGSVNSSGIFNNLSAGKRSMTANLYNPEGMEVIERLVRVSDVIIENFSARVFERWGLTWERLRALNPRIVYISLSGFGHLGRDAEYVTWGPTAAALSGVTYMSGLPDNEAAGWGFSYLDHYAGYLGAVAALMALHHREETGEGQYVDMSQVETGMTLCGVPLLDYQVNGREYERIGNHSRWPAVAPHAAYRCKDGLEGEDRWLAIAAETEEQWRALCDVLGASELAADARFSSLARRVERQEALDTALTEHTRRFDARELMYLLQAKGVPAGACQTYRDKLELDPQLAGRGFFPEADHPELGRHRFEGMPLRFSDARWQIDSGAPCLGADTLNVLTRLLGYSDEEADRLVAEAAV